ncbi:MAG TPA: hypothetical protein VE998_10260 [Terriglobales bacterium]|nr:hypothetical protein [Terriglobales bacterium]
MLRRRTIFVLLVGITLAGALQAKDKKGYAPPKLVSATEYPANDQHTAEKVTVAADPYDTRAKQDEAFGVPFRQVGFMPILVVITNDGDQPITLSDMHVELVAARKLKVLAAEEDDIRRRMERRPQTAPSPLPFPLPHGKNPIQELHEEFDQASFAAHAVEPHSTQGGFFFFDVSGVSDPLSGATLTITRIKNNDGKELFYFEVPLDKYLNQRPELNPR